MWLLDTNILVLLAIGPDRIPEKVQQQAFERPDHVYASSINFWEIAIKRDRDSELVSIDLDDLRHALLAIGYRILPFTADHALAVQDLPAIHRDPFDRGLVAQARCEGLTLITRDAVLPRYPMPTVRI